MAIPGTKIFGDESVYTDWLPRSADNMIARAELIDASTADLSVTVRVFTKNSEDAGDGDEVYDGAMSSAPYIVTLSSAGTVFGQFVVISKATSGGEVRGLKELVRFEVTGAISGSATSTDWAHMRLFPPIFFPQAVTA